MDNKSPLALLFDVSFTEFITTRVIKALFIISVVFAGIGSLTFLWTGIRGGFLKGILFLILTPVVFLLWTLMARIWCELIIVAFRIAENTGKMVEQPKG